jgi:threonine dehydrogenase-like Zn-dependent dehydrogenase
VLAARLTGPRRFELAAQTPSSPDPGWVRVRVRECGICGSDMKMYAGEHPVHRPPLQLGHELIGSVVAPDGSLIADEVAVFPAVGCGDCYACRRDREELCAGMRLIGGHLPGGLATEVEVPARNAVPIPSGVPADRRVLIEPLAVAVHAAALGAAGPADRALVIGAGPIGLFTALVLRHTGCARAVVVDRDPARVELAVELGVDAELVDGQDVAGMLAQLAAPEGFEVVFDCAGAAATPDQAVRSLVPGGVAVLVGVPPSVISFDSIALQRGGRTVRGSMMYSHADFRAAMDLLADGAVSDAHIASGLVRREFPLERVEDAFRAVEDGAERVLKVVVVPQP